MAPFDLEKALLRLDNREALDRVRAQGVRLRFVALMDARAAFLGLVREAGETEIVLTRRGWPVAALVSRSRWMALHQRVDDLEDLIACHRWVERPENGRDLVGLLPESYHEFERRARSPSWKWLPPVPPRYRVVLAPEAAAVVAGCSGFDGEALLRRLDELRRLPERVETRRIEREPHVRTLQTRAHRIVWRIDGENVAVVRIVRLVPSEPAT